jgi:hypothetical protein
MDEPFKTRELSEWFCDLDGVYDQDKRDRRYSQLRIIVQKGLIRPTTNEISRGKVARYNIEDAAIARLLFRLYELNFPMHLLRGLEPGLRPRPKGVEYYRDKKGVHRERPIWHEGTEERHISNVLPKIAAGEFWVYEVTPKRDDRGEITMVSSYFRPESEPSVWSLYRKELEEFDNWQGHTREPTILIPATELLRRMLNREAEG